jgi:hypothetical protein
VTGIIERQFSFVAWTGLTKGEQLQVQGKNEIKYRKNYIREKYKMMGDDTTRGGGQKLATISTSSANSVRGTSFSLR